MPSVNQAQADVQRLRDQMAQAQVSTVEHIAQLKEKATSREVEAKRKYDELQLQPQNMMKMFQQNQSQNPPS
ncbi:Adenylate kinase [Gossypium arboreum]|nr:Adenylate kinase [Gossypium arboreum]